METVIFQLKFPIQNQNGSQDGQVVVFKTFGKVIKRRRVSLVLPVGQRKKTKKFYSLLRCGTCQALFLDAEHLYNQSLHADSVPQSLPSSNPHFLSRSQLLVCPHLKLVNHFLSLTLKDTTFLGPSHLQQNSLVQVFSAFNPYTQTSCIGCRC